MVILYFVLAAIGVIISAIYLNKYADVIGEKSALSGAMIGGFLIAATTSLPELSTSITAAVIDNPDIAVGNLLGSNVFNIFILIIIDLVNRRKRALNSINSPAQASSIYAGVLFTLFIIIAILWDGTPSLFNVGIEMYVIAIGYIFMIKQFNNPEESPADTSETETPSDEDNISVRKAGILFGVAAVTVAVFGSILSITGDQVAQITGMSSNFIGSILIAATTSLPELVTVIIAYRMANYIIAVGTILGSNIFNLLLLALTDGLYRPDAILQGTSPSMIWIALFGLVLMLMMLYILKRKPRTSTIGYIWPLLLTIVLYISISFLLFYYG